MTCLAPKASSSPRIPPAKASTMLSASNSPLNSLRVAPSATRSEVSPARSNALPSKSEATLMQAIRNTEPAINLSSVMIDANPLAVDGSIPL